MERYASPQNHEYQGIPVAPRPPSVMEGFENDLHRDTDRILGAAVQIEDLLDRLIGPQLEKDPGLARPAGVEAVPSGIERVSRAMNRLSHSTDRLGVAVSRLQELNLA